MKRIIIDTNIWSLALRRKNTNLEILKTLTNLIESHKAILIGPVRQEVLSGFRQKDQFEKLRNKLRAFPDFPITTNDYEKASEFHSLCTQNGIACTPVDLLICAIAFNNGLGIYTLDKDFTNYQQVIPIDLFEA